MTKALKKTPRVWLTLKKSKDIFIKFNHLIQFDEPIPPFDTCNMNKLEGILNSVKQTYDRKQLNPTIAEASAAYLNQIIRGHPFLNGNKRIAILLTHVFLLMNGCDLSLTYKGLYNFTILLAKSSEYLSPNETKSICKRVILDFGTKYEKDED